jgi:hypothetical protein
MLQRRKTKKQFVFCLRMVLSFHQIWQMADLTHHCTTALVWSGPISCGTNCLWMLLNCDTSSYFKTLKLQSAAAL